MTTSTQEIRLEMEISWLNPKTNKHFTHTVKALLDSGTETWIMSWDCVKKADIPVQKRPILLLIKQADGSHMPHSGTHITQPLTLRIGSHLGRLVTCEIGTFAGEDLVIPHRWLEKHQPTIHWVQNKATFNRIQCQIKGCMITEKDMYEEGWQEKVVRLLRHMPEPDMPLESYPFWARNTGSETLASAILEEFQDHVGVFSPEGAGCLPEHSEWDHKIPLVDGSQPPWGPIYALSPPEQKALREYLDEMLAAGKIVPSSSSAAAPILFIPKQDGSLCPDVLTLVPRVR